MTSLRFRAAGLDDAAKVAALVNGAAGVVVAPHGRPISIMGFSVRRGDLAVRND